MQLNSVYFNSDFYLKIQNFDFPSIYFEKRKKKRKIIEVNEIIINKNNYY